MLGKEMRRDVIDLHYHMSMHALDPMNAVNPEPSSARAFNYGVSEVPFSVLDGGTDTSLRFTLNALQESSPRDRIRLLTLEEPSFDIDLEADWGETGMEVRTGITCLKERYDSFVQLYLVVFETSVTSYMTEQGSAAFRNVVRDMLPSPSGTLMGDRWQKGTHAQQTDTWSYPPYVEDPEELAVAAFVQDRNTGQILQASVQYRDPTVGMAGSTAVIDQMTLYPNPAGSLVYVSLGSGIRDQSRLVVMDMGGKTVLELMVPPGTERLPVQLGMLKRGIYLVRWTEEGNLLGVSKLVKVIE
jgi:hypothetical protein